MADSISLNDSGEDTISNIKDSGGDEQPLFVDTTNNTSLRVNSAGGDMSIEENGGETTVIQGQEAPKTEEPLPFVMPDKFAKLDKEDIAKAYVELERMKGSTPPTEAPTEALPQAPTDTEDFSVQKYQELWAKQGFKLEDNQWDAIAKQTGVPMDTLKAWEQHSVKQINTQVNSELTTNDQLIYGEVGGEESYGKMIGWAEKNLSDVQIDNLNMQLDNPNFSKQGASLLKSLYTNAVGTEPQIQLTNVASSNIIVDEANEFYSNKDIQNSMRDPQYGQEGAFDREFDKKLTRYMARQQKG